MTLMRQVEGFCDTEMDVCRDGVTAQNGEDEEKKRKEDRG